MRNKKIVCFGGGSAMPQVILETLKKYPAEITSVTSMADDGGSTGQLRRDFGVAAPGDIRRHILAFSDAPKWKKDLWGFRFGNEEFEGGHKGHSFGNVFIVGLSRNIKNYGDVLEKCRQFMEISKKYKALPATMGNITLCAELEDGQIVEGESAIDVPKDRDANLKIKKIFLKSQAKAYPEVLSEIKKADFLVFGPGDLYSSILPCFLPLGIKKAIASSRAQKILVSNIMNKKGETGGFSVEEFARETEKYIGTELDFVLYNKDIPDNTLVQKKRKEDASILDSVEFSGNLDRERFIGANLVKRDTVSHDPAKTGRAIWKLMN
ncbi:MAG: YvcK family protein [Candidatus Pacebacteria bacterium]|nr:YvcK family protein [Candidatus Paceibacterota bacterium]